ncbi:MAG: phenylalanine--tRNA ligase subunit beta [Candidatus Peribacteraceae bacterium]|nr:phenylalanine--tRNA ligase subunit beta [Candidatus Peribacteraceae bacterium]MDD5742794.1 phenylalanine--tRNA ligase subunit beta [Candidatus Peribacteraceae bacterium]
MKVSLEWLADFVTWKEKDPHVIAERLTASTGEVEEIDAQGAQLKGCCVGKVLSLAKHPNADRLSVCDVQTDQGKKHVVCGGTNLRLGMHVAFAHVGTVVAGPDGKSFLLQKAKIRGEDSDGMICSSPELKLTDRFPMKPEQGSRPVIDLGDGNDGVGRPLAEYLGLNDVIFHIDNHAITNRPDLFSHVGVARECVTLGLATWKKAIPSKSPVFPKISLPFDIVLEQKSLLPRYLGCGITIGAPGETPPWMKRRLESLGSRSLSLPIDITNYVMMEYGVPLHSFDADDLAGDVHVRSSTEGDTITTLDEVKRTLPAGAIVIHDDRGIFDLLPIMGGLRSSTKPTTRHIYLQSVSADPVAVRTGIIGTGLRTEAATISEKGIPPIRAKEAFFRALELFLTLVPGAAITSKLVSWGTDGAPKPIKFSAKQAERILGTTIPEKTTKKILIDLGFKVGRGTVTPPLWRIKDIAGPHDLAEEIGRIMGYDRITPALPVASVRLPPRERRVHQLRDSLKEQGFTEVVPLSLVGPDLLAKCGLQASEACQVENALGEELSLLQTSTLPRLLEHASQNLLQVSDAVRTFTCAHVFNRREGEWLECGILIAERRALPLSATPFLAMKQLVGDQLTGSGVTLELREAATTPPFAHPGRSAEFLVEGKVVGLVCELKPAVCSAFDLPGRAAVVLLDLTQMLALPSQPVIFSPIPQYPSISYDLTVTLDASQKSADFITKVRKSSPLLADVSVIDLFEGKQLPKGAYNLTVRCTYRASDRTLTEEEVKREHEKIGLGIGGRA